MIRRTDAKRSAVAGFTLALLMLPGTHAAAQDAPPLRFGVGIVANAPDQMAGASVMVMSAKGFGIYADVKFNVDAASREESFDGTRTALEIENEVDGVTFVDSQDSYQSFNAALVYQATPALQAYAGAGIANMTRYRQYRDPSEQLGMAGFFWVEGPDEARTFTNFLVGIFMRVSPRVSLQTGYETAPKGLTMGASVRFPKQ
jgi:hypothetical protein